MSSASRKLIQASGGAAGAGAGEAVYVDDVFSTFLYDGNSSSQRIQNNIALADGAENNTTLQITGDGSISDDSPFGYSLTSSSSMTTSTSVKKFGSGSMHFPYNTTLPTVSASTDSAPQGTEDFTIEGWIYHSAANGSFRTIYASGYPIQLYVNSNNVIAYCSSSTTSPSYFVNGIGGPSNSLQNNTWTHFAFVRNGNSFTVYVNGNAGTSTTSSSAVAAASRSILGGFSTTLYGICLNSGENAYIDDFRITRGRAVYTSAFTPPTSALDLDTAVTGKGGLVWIKERTVTQNNVLTDTERGATKTLVANATSAESTDTSHLTAFNSDGFTIANGNEVNQNSQDFVSWTFRKQPGFFDVVTWSGDGTTDRQISHSLGSTPGMIIVKSRTGSDKWYTYHRSLGSGKYVSIESASSVFTDSGPFGTDPTSSVFTVGNPGYLNYSGWDYVAYVFAHDAQDFGTDSDEAIIKCDSYTGTGSEFEVNLGFEPQWLFVKNVNNSSYYWWVLDTMRGLDHSETRFLYSNVGNTEAGGGVYYIPTPTGFTVKGITGPNNSGNEYIYTAIRRPHKPASEFEATDMFNTGVGVYNAYPTFQTGFVTDMGIEKNVNGTDGNYIFNRLTGVNYLKTDNTNSETSGSSVTWDYQDGMLDSFGTAGNYNWWGFKRVPGFFDVVTYAGNGTAGRTVNHNLGVVPEMMWVKNRDAAQSWEVYSESISNTERLILNLDLAAISGTAQWNSTSPTDSVFTLGNDAGVNANGNDYIAYLFASVPGISKVGSYTGTGANLDIDCGFTTGARFVLVKRTDFTGDWYVWDSERGIVAGNDPYLFLNSTAAQVTSTDYIDPLSSGFTITSSAPAALNASGGTYLFLAIA